MRMKRRMKQAMPVAFESYARRICKLYPSICSVSHSVYRAHLRSKRCSLVLFIAIRKYNIVWHFPPNPMTIYDLTKLANDVCLNCTNHLYFKLFSLVSMMLPASWTGLHAPDLQKTNLMA